MIQNPILPGFYPDPSICRVEDDFYLVTSSFSYYPGVPIFHSKDLVHWEQLGHVLDRPSQLPCSYEMISGGIFAPTIRYHEGVFYMITTNMSMGCKNFVVTATDPKGPWSEMHIIEGADGIDPSLFFDEDGKAYYTGTTRVNESDGNYQAIWCSEIDVKEMKLVGERRILWRGAMFNSYAPEGPHLYKKDGWYYLLIAEGGTEHMHAVTIARSKEIMGTYEGYQGNPILTHRHLGKMYPICNVGHADLVELKDGSWYMVMLASRLMDGYHKILGRETFLVPVTWEDGWPIVSPGTGKVEASYPHPKSLPEHCFQEEALPFQTNTDFEEEELGLEWNMLGAPKGQFYSLEDSCLKLKVLKNELVPWELDGLSANVFERIPMFHGGNGDVSFLGRRQQHLSFKAKTLMYFKPKKDEAAGMVIIQNDANQLRLEIRRTEDDKIEATCIRTQTFIREGKQYFEETTVGSSLLNESSAFHSDDQKEMAFHLKVTGNGVYYSFYVSLDGETDHTIAENVDGSFMGSETCGGFVGAYIGLYAFCDKEDRDAYAAFDYFTYEP